MYYERHMKHFHICLQLFLTDSLTDYDDTPPCAAALFILELVSLIYALSLNFFSKFPAYHIETKRVLGCC